MSALQLDRSFAIGAASAIDEADSARRSALSILGQGLTVEDANKNFAISMNAIQEMKNNPKNKIQPPGNTTPEDANQWDHPNSTTPKAADGTITEIPPPVISLDRTKMNQAVGAILGSNGVA